MNHKLFIWLKAARLPSQSYILLPILLGQMIAYYTSREFSLELFFFLLAYSIFIQLFIIFANDYADQGTDSLNQTYTIFSGGSRVLVDGELQSTDLKKAAIVCMIFCLGIGIILSIAYQRYVSLAFVFASLFLLWAYSYKPFQLSYRGGGELLQTLGLGFILPYFAFYIQSDSLIEFPFILLGILLPTHLACAIATSLPDQPSDKISLKKTFTVKYGSLIAKSSILIFQSISTVHLWLLFYSIINYNFAEIIFLLPLLGIILSLPFIKSKPSELGLSLFVFFSLFTTMVIEMGLILIYYVLS